MPEERKEDQAEHDEITCLSWPVLLICSGPMALIMSNGSQVVYGSL